MAGYRYSPSRHPPGYHYPGYTPPPPSGHGQPGTLPHGSYSGHNMVVGLKSVAQLTLEVLISGFRGITEGYNLATVGRINNHFVILGNK